MGLTGVNEGFKVHMFYQFSFEMLLPCINWTFASIVGDLRSYPIIYSTYNKIKLSIKLVGNYPIIQPACNHMTSSVCQIDHL